MENKSTLVDEFIEDYEEEEEELEEMEIESEKEKKINFEFSSNLEKNLKEIREYVSKGEPTLLGSTFIEDPEYDCVVKNNSILLKIDEEMITFHKYIQEMYSKKFSELEQHVMNPLDYARVVKMIGDSKDISNIDFSSILPSSTSIVLKITFSTSKPELELTNEEMEKIYKGCDEILKLEKIKKEILSYISSRMNIVSPSLSLLVGTTIAAQLIGTAGGLEELSKIPGPNIQLLGRTKRSLSGFSSKTLNPFGFIGNCELVQSSPPSLRKKIVRIVSMKAAIAARIDSFGNIDQDRIKGENILKEIQDSIEKLQLPPPPKQEKPLPVPIEKAKSRRGGKNARRIKEKYKPTLMMKKMNRVAFGVEQVEDMETGEGYGMLGVDGQGSSGKMKAKSKIKTKQWEKKKNSSHPSGFQTSFVEGSGTVTNQSGFKTTSGISTSGFTTSSAFSSTGGGGGSTNMMMGPPPPNVKKNEDYFSNLKFKKLK
jgi:U4/U6 small nuclear ribonucleoprotein PRP31